MADQNSYGEFNMSSKKSKNEQSVKSVLLSKLTLILWVFIGIGLFLIGLRIFDGDEGSMEVLSDIDDVLAICIAGMAYFFIFLPRYTSIIKRTLLTFLVFIVSSLLFYLLGDYLLTPVIYLIGIGSILIGVVLFVNFLRSLHDRHYQLRPLIWSLIYLIVGYGFFKSGKVAGLQIFLGLYLIYLGYYFTKQSLKALFHFRKNPKEKYQRVVTLPTFLSAFIPIGFFSQVNHRINQIDSKKIDHDLFYEDTPEENEEKSEDLVVYIHTRAGLMPGFGHVDISYNGRVFCYGNYDDSTWKLGGMFSDGVMVTTSPENHIQNALTNDKKILIAYTLKISEKTKEKINAQLREIMAKGYRWKPPAELAAEGQISGPPEKYTDVSSTMYLNEKTQFYKFYKGSPYRTYFLLGQNCAMFANDIIGHSGIKLVRLNRIVTPGTYLEYLNQLYVMKHTIVVDRKIYMLNENGKPYLLSEQNEAEIEDKIR